MKQKQENNDFLIEAKNVVKIFNKGMPNEVVALSDINLQIRKGEALTIMGPSGSGKTTLLNCISGIDDATRGEIWIARQNLQKMSDNKKTKYRSQKMGFIFQSFNLIPVLNALENVELPLLLNGYKPKEARKKAKLMLDKVGLSERYYHKPNELSGGQKQRVTIARALVHSPEVIWADEPTGNLDRKTAFEIFDLMVKLNHELGVTLVVVTHDQEIAEKTDRIIYMESGKIKNFDKI
ncbi:MAG: ABC transporter ATP-binding protein [Candidatus Dojkabacteria bacterium]|nr:MAG: ABC transporter ATP-binding protein [Candidatus Dojkabacteria bacterium]